MANGKKYVFLNIVMWNFELFFARRIASGKRHKSSVSAPITKIGIIAVGLAIAVMLIAVATGVGLQKKIEEKISGFNGHIRIVNYDLNNSLVSVEPVSLRQDFYPVFDQVKGISHIQVFATKAGIIKTETDFEGVVLKGVGADYDWRFFRAYLTAGALPDFSGDKPSNEVLISATLSARLQLHTGDSIVVWFVRKDLDKMPKVRKFRVSGIYDSGFPEFDKTYVIGDIRQIQRLNKWKPGQVGGFEILVSDFDQIGNITRKVYRHIPPELNAYSIVEKFPVIFEWISLFDSNIAVILFLMFLVSGFNMITVLLVMVLEQTRTVGILKALGSGNRSIRRIFLLQATRLVIRGVLWGNALGLSLLLLQKYTGFLKLDPQTYYVSHVPVDVNPWHILLLNTGVVVLTYLLLVLPSYFIVKVDPVRAIRFE